MKPLKVQGLFLGLYIWSSVAANATLLDQNTLLPQLTFPGMWSDYGFESWYRVGLTFQTGFTGHLDRIDIQVSSIHPDAVANGTVVPFALYATSENGLPIGDPLAVSSISPPEDYDPDGLQHYTVSMDFSAQDVLLSAGTTFALVAETSDLVDPWGAWLISVNTLPFDRYEFGSGLVQYFDDPWVNLDFVDDQWPFDAAFATYMTPVPIPASLPLFLSSLGLIAALLRRASAI